MPAGSSAPIATHLRFDHPDVRVWEMDLAPGQICPLHRHTNDYVLFIIAGGLIEVESPGATSNRFPGRTRYELQVGSRTISYVPAGGAESARNIGSGRFREAIFEILRPLPSGAPNPGFALTEGLAGSLPTPGIRMLLENSRIRATEATLASGEKTDATPLARDAAIFVLEGATVRLNRSVIDLANSAVLWQTRGSVREIENLSEGFYRELRVEFR